MNETNDALSNIPEHPAVTLSNAARIAAMHTALERMIADLGEQPFSFVIFEIGSDRFSDLPVTTWLDLQSARHVEPISPTDYQLTGRGWIEGLKLTGAYDSPEQRERVIRLRAALKDCIKGREIHGAITDVSLLHQATGLPEHWIGSALMSRLLQHKWPTDHLDVDLTHGLGGIRVPARFGTQRLFGDEAGPFADP